MAEMYCISWASAAARFSYSGELESLTVAQAVYLPLRVDNHLGDIFEQVSCNDLCLWL